MSILGDTERDLIDHKSEKTVQNLGVAAVAVAVHESHVM